MAEKGEKIDMYVFPVHMIALRNLMVARYFPPLCDNAMAVYSSRDC